MARPSTSAPLSASIARWQASSDSISTKPNPRERPVSRSEITSAELTPPWALNKASKEADVVDQGRLPT